MARRWLPLGDPVSLNAAIGAELPYLRAEAEARMTSRATIRRKTGHWVQIEETGEEVPVWAVVHADVPFRLGGGAEAFSTGSTRRQNIGGIEIQTATRVGHLPVWVDGLSDGDWIDVLSGDNAGRAFSIIEADFKDQATARRVPVLAQDRPEEWP